MARGKGHLSSMNAVLLAFGETKKRQHRQLSLFDWELGRIHRICVCHFAFCLLRSTRNEKVIQMDTCYGRLKNEDLALLKKAVEEDGDSAPETYDTYTCDACGQTGLLAKEYGGDWLPDTHYPPPRKRANPSGKSDHYKRTPR